MNEALQFDYIIKTMSKAQCLTNYTKNVFTPPYVVYILLTSTWIYLTLTWRENNNVNKFLSQYYNHRNNHRSSWKRVLQHFKSSNIIRTNDKANAEHRTYRKKNLPHLTLTWKTWARFNVSQSIQKGLHSGWWLEEVLLSSFCSKTKHIDRKSVV